MFCGEQALRGDEIGQSIDWADALGRAQSTHSQKSEALVEAFTARILASFSEPAALAGPSRQLPRQPVGTLRPRQGQLQEVLVKAFVGLCAHAQAENPALTTLADLQLVSKVLKLAQLLLK